MWTPKTLKTERLELRALTRSDADSIFRYARNPEVSKYTLWEPHQSIDDSLDYIENYAFELYNTETPEPFAITLIEENHKMIGTIGCFWVSKSAKEMELAFALDQDYWRKGITTEASRKILEHCFNDLSAHRIQCRCKAENIGSAKVMQNLGMQYEGTLRDKVYHRGRYWDMRYYSIFKNDFYD